MLQMSPWPGTKSMPLACSAKAIPARAAPMGFPHGVSRHRCFSPRSTRPSFSTGSAGFLVLNSYVCYRDEFGRQTLIANDVFGATIAGTWPTGSARRS